MSNNKNNTTIEKLISACAGALITSLMVTPMDVIKMRLQTQQRTVPKYCCTALSQCNLTQPMTLLKKIPFRKTKFQMANIHECAIAQQQPLIFRGTFDGIYKIIKYEGVKALWKGLSPALVMSIPANVIYFVGYEQLKDSIPSQDYAPLIAGAVARTVAVTMISPIELFRTRLQATVGAHDFKSKPTYFVCNTLINCSLYRYFRRNTRYGRSGWIESIMERITAYIMERCTILCYLLDGL